MEKLSSITSCSDIAPKTVFGVRRYFTLRPPRYNVLKDLVRFGDASVLLLSGLVERVPGVQDALAATYDHNHLLANIVGGCITFGILNTAQGYKIRVLKNYFKQMKRAPLALLAGTFGVYGSLSIMHHDTIESMTGSLRWCFLSTIALSSFRGITTYFIQSWVKSGEIACRIALVGVDEYTQAFIDVAQHHKDTCNIVGLYTYEEVSQTRQNHVNVIGPVEQILRDSQDQLFDSIVISHQHTADLNSIYEKVFPVVANIHLIGESLDPKVSQDRITEVGGNLVVNVLPVPLTDWQRYQKNVFDVFFGSIALICLSPLIAVTALLIKLESPGPILFRQPREGFNNMPFITYKFRSMYIEHADLHANKQTTRNDNRITRVGKIIRRFSIDELPQLINVLQGNMSLVGPRPHAQGTKAGDQLFADVVATYPLRHKVKPGITGLAQINGYRGATPDEESIRKRVEYDLAYIESWSIWLDIKIIILTVFREILSTKAF